MYGAILGDIIGSPYEFDRGNKSKDFPLFSRNSKFTDDSVMTLAVADAFLFLPPLRRIQMTRRFDAGLSGPCRPMGGNTLTPDTAECSAAG